MRNFKCADGDRLGRWRRWNTRKTHGQEREMTHMRQFTQLAYDLHRQRLARAVQQRPAQHLLALRRAARRAGPGSAGVIS